MSAQPTIIALTRRDDQFDQKPPYIPHIPHYPRFESYTINPHSPAFVEVDKLRRMSTVRRFHRPTSTPRRERCARRQQPEYFSISAQSTVSSLRLSTSRAAEHRNSARSSTCFRLQPRACTRQHQRQVPVCRETGFRMFSGTSGRCSVGVDRPRNLSVSPQ